MATKAYSKPIQSAREEALRSPDGEKAQLLSRIEDAWGSVIVEVSRSNSPRATLDEGLQALQASLTGELSSAKEQAVEKERQAHLDGYAAAASVATGTAPEWSPDLSSGFTRRGIDRSNEQLVRSALESGISYFRQDLQYIEKYVEPERYARAMAEVLAREHPSLLRRLQADGLVLDEDIEFSEARSPQVFQNLRRTGVTELSDVMDEAGKELAAQSPAVDLVEWTLSSRHDSLESSPDSCDWLAKADPYGYGPGRYHSKTTPSHPHPHCECSIVCIVPEDTSEWVNDRPLPDRPEIGAGDLAGRFEDLPGERSITDAHVQSQKQQLDRAMRLVHDDPRGL
jgi:hypothetical protein